MSAKLQTFAKKDIAIEALNKHNANITLKKNMRRLYAADINDKGAKCFLIETRKTMAEYARLENSSYYENIMPDEQVKLFFDIDIKNDNQIYKSDKLTICVDKCIREYNLIIAKYTNIQPQCIILTASTLTKLSAHIIYTNIHFKTIQIMKHFIAEVSKSIRELMHVDSVVYRIGCFRCIWSSKKGKDNRLVYSRCHGFTPPDDYSKGYKVFYDSQLTWINPQSTLIEYRIIEKPQITKITTTAKVGVITRNIKIENAAILKISNIFGTTSQYKLIKQIIECIKLSRADNFSDWIKIGLCLKSIENSERYFYIFDEFSKKSDKYLSIIDSICTWNGLNLNPNYCGISMLRFLASKDNPLKYIEIKQHIEPDKKLFETIKFSSNFVFDMNLLIKDQVKNGLANNVKNKDFVHSIVCEHIINWIESDIKTFALKSAYGTGKTELLKTIFKQYFAQFKRILIITHRASLALEFSTIFKDFYLYTDGMYDEDRYICQMESLHHIEEFAFRNGAESEKSYYDLIVIDEIVYVLRHFDSSTLKDPEGVYKHFQELISNAKKLIVCDGDFDNSAFEFINQFGKSVILENTIKKSNKCLEFIKIKKVFENKLEKDLKNKKNIFLVCMSSNSALKYADKYKMYNPIVYYGDMDDKTRLQLKNVNVEWRKTQLVIVTPVVESGISFNGLYFYKQYVVLSEKSTSPRALMQMMSRVRQFEVDDVPVHINKLPFSDRECSVNFNCVKNYVIGIKKMFNGRTVLTNCDKMFVYNKMESANKNRNNFIPVTISLCKEKGYTWKYNDKKIEKGDNISENQNINFNADFTNVKIIDTDTANDLKKLLCKGGCSKEKKLEIKLHDFAMDWKLDLLKLNYYVINKSYEGRDEVKHVVNDKLEQNAKDEDYAVKEKEVNTNDDDLDDDDDEDLMLCFSEDEKKNIKVTNTSINKDVMAKNIINDYDYAYAYDDDDCNVDYDGDNKYIPNGYEFNELRDYPSRYISSDLTIDKEFATVWYKKTYILYNLRELLGKTNKYNDMDGDNFRKEVQYTKILLVRKLIKDLGFFNLVGDIAIGQEIIINSDEMKTRVDKIVIGDIFMKNDIDIMFDKVPGTFQKAVDKYLASTKTGFLIRFINDHVLCNYGCVIEKDRIRIKINN
jgi:hypothetical protein